jgi:hypothetical protein
MRVTVGRNDAEDGERRLAYRCLGRDALALTDAIQDLSETISANAEFQFALLKCLARHLDEGHKLAGFFSDARQRMKQLPMTACQIHQRRCSATQAVFQNARLIISALCPCSSNNESPAHLPA